MTAMIETQDTLANLLHWARDSEHMTRQHVAKRLKVDYMDVVRWENGDSRPPEDVLQRLAGFYERTRSYFDSPELPMDETCHVIKVSFTGANNHVICLNYNDIYESLSVDMGIDEEYDDAFRWKPGSQITLTVDSMTCEEWLGIEEFTGW